MRPREIAFVGGSVTSAIGNVHRIASQMDGCFRLSAGCFSRSRDLNQRTASSWNIAASRTYETPEELAIGESSRNSVVAVLTPVFSHFEIIKHLLESGLDVISEKPLVANLKEGKELLQISQKSQTRLFVTFNYTGYPMVRELRRRISRGDFGTVYQMRLTMQQEGYVKRNSNGTPIPPQDWRLIDREIPTVSLDLGMHVVHLQQFLLPQSPVSVMSRMDSFGAFREVIDDVEVMYRCEKGLLVHGWWSKAAAGYANGLSIEVFGSEGSANWIQSDPELLHLRSVNGSMTNIHRGTSTVLEAGQPRYNRFKAGHPDGFIEAFANIYQDFSSELGESDNVGDSPVHDFDAGQSLALIKLLDAATRSAQARVELTIDN